MTEVSHKICYTYISNLALLRPVDIGTHTCSLYAHMCMHMHEITLSSVHSDLEPCTSCPGHTLSVPFHVEG